VLPFSGGQGDEGEDLAEKLSFEKALAAAFDIVPRTTINQAIKNEQRFQMTSGMTDADTLAAIGRQLGAQFVLSGTIARLGSQNLLVTSIVHIEDLRQISGDIQVYASKTEIQKRLPDMAKNIVEASQNDVSALPLLAVLPVVLRDGADSIEADALTQILTIHLIHTGKYAVYPRTKSLEQVQTELGNQFGGDVADEYLPHIGKGNNPRQVLSVVRRGDSSFNASILNLETGLQETGATVECRTFDDGIVAMQVLALKLIGQEDEAELLALQLAGREKEVEARQKAQRRAAEAMYLFNSVGAAAGSSFTAPWLIFNISGTYSFWAHTFFDAGLDAGFIHGYEDTDIRYSSLYPYMHFNGYWPGNNVGASLGAGAGLMAAFYETDDEKSTIKTPSLDLTAGLYLGAKKHYVSIVYSFRTPFDRLFTAINHRLTMCYRFRFE
jgi:hypothetical protein